MREGIDVANDVRKIYYWQKSVEISKGLSKDINHRADNTMKKKQKQNNNTNNINTNHYTAPAPPECYC